MLSIAAGIYGKIADVRNRLYDRGVFKTFDLGARTISIGNITTGGTGKTPLVAYVASLLAERGETVCILTRGYGRADENKRVLVSNFDGVLADVREAGDEPLELAQKLLGKAIVIADANRVKAAEWAKKEFGVTVFVLDDGFQHRRVRRDVDLVCIDASNPFGSGRMLPTGRLREPLHNLNRADGIVITRVELVLEISNLRSAISKVNPDALLFVVKTKLNRLVNLTNFGTAADVGEESRGRVTAAFCGLGNPESFYALLRENKIEPLVTKNFPDHHAYSQTDIDILTREFVAKGAEIILTTAKDAEKLSHLSFALPCRVVEMDITIDNPEAFSSLL